LTTAPLDKLLLNPSSLFAAAQPTTWRTCSLGRCQLLPQLRALLLLRSQRSLQVCLLLLHLLCVLCTLCCRKLQLSL
jgi:hypothetical protein